MSTKTTTRSERLRRSRIAQLHVALCDLYDRAFPSNTPPESFWIKFDEIDRKLSKAVAVDPLSNSTIVDAGKEAQRQFIKLCKAHLRG